MKKRKQGDGLGSKRSLVRDGATGTIIVLHATPRDLSSDVGRYVRRRGLAQLRKPLTN